MSSDVAIRVEGIHKRYGQTHAVNDVSFDVPAGSLCGFIGANGAGKSTTIRMIMSIIYPDEGSISVLGSSALRAKDRIGYLPEERGVYRKMRVGEFLHYIAKLKGLDSTGLKTRILDWLDRIQLPDVYRKRCQELSKGMQQKVQFLAAVLHEPELIILDEPFSGLDPVNTRLLGSIVEELHAEGRTVIFSTHVLHQAERMCERILLIDRGRLLLDDTLDDVRARFDPRTLLAEPDGAMNGLVDRVRSVEGVADARLGEDGECVEMTIVEGSDGHQVMRAVHDLAPLRRIEWRRTTLDEVFVRLTGTSVDERGMEADDDE